MKSITNVFVTTTEYHFLLSMSIISQKYNSQEFKNIIVFTGRRLSGVVVEALPSSVEVFTVLIDEEKNLKGKVNRIFFQQNIQNLFVFTAYRFLETYLLNKISKTTQRHLVQDGANFYFNIEKSVFVSRLKETLRIYKDLWTRGFFFIRPVLYKKHLAQCSFIDFVWVTNPEVYQEPLFFRKPIIKIELLLNERDWTESARYFTGFEKRDYNNYLIYLSTRLTQKETIQREIELIKSVIKKFGARNLLVKLHPDASIAQADLIKTLFGANAIKNSVPAELYMAHAKNSLVIGTASAALYYHNSSCRYFSLIKIYQQLQLFPPWVEVKFPGHVKILGNLNEL